MAVQCCHASMAFLQNMIVEKSVRCLDKQFQELPADDGNGHPVLYKRADLNQWSEQAFKNGKKAFFVEHDAQDYYLLKQVEDSEVSYRIKAELQLDVPTVEEWFGGLYIKTICGAKNRYQLLKAVMLAESIGLEKDKDFFLIYDACLTELSPEEYDESGNGRILTSIGFRPLPDEIAHQISRKYQLF